MTESDFSALWTSCFKANYEEYYKIYERVMSAKFENPLNDTRIPLRIFFKGNDYRTSRALDRYLSLVDAIKQIFPKCYDQADGRIKEEFRTVDVTVGGIPLSSTMSLEYLYKLFCNPDGYLYLTVSI